MSYEEEQAERVRRRAFVVLAFALAIWAFSFLFADSFLYGSRWGKIGTRLYQLAWAGGMVVWLRRPRRLATIEALLVGGGSGLMILSAISLLKLQDDQIVFAVVTRLLGVLFATYALQLRWKASAVGYVVTAVTMLGGYLIRVPDEGPRRVLLASMWVIVPLPVFVYAAYRRERQQRDELALRQALEHANARLADEVETRTRLFLGLNHDLRTPLSVIRAESEALAAKSADPIARGAAARIVAGTRYAADLVDQLLGLARLDEGRPWGSPVPHRVDTLVGALVAQLEPAQGAHIRLDAEPAVARADPGHVRRIVVNLVANALRSIEPGEGNVEVRVRAQAGSVRVEVSDDGRGVPDALRERLFDRFATMDPSGSVVSGIGLPLARELAERNGGTLELLECRPARFALALPASDEEPVALELDEPTSLRAAATSHAAAPPAGAPRLLVIEDQPRLAALLAEQLGADYLVIVAGSLADARRAIDEEAPRLVLSDVMLPDGRGTALIAELRDRFGSAAPPFVLLSALGDPEARTEGLSAGADDYIVKPFSMSELRARLERALRTAAEHELSLERQRDDLLMELHDGVGGSMARAMVALSSTPTDGGDRARVELREGLSELRDALRQLERREATWAELAAELRRATADAAESAGLELIASVEPAAAPVSVAAAHALRRLVREATTNVIRHAAAHRMGLTLRAVDDTAHVTLWDDGRGLDGRPAGRGIGAMKRRAARLSGSVSVEPRAGGGTTVEIVLPLEPRRASRSTPVSARPDDASASTKRYRSSASATTGQSSS